MSIGANDLLGILGNTSLTSQQQTSDVSDAVANEITFVKQLVSDGAKNLLVLDVPDRQDASVLQGRAMVAYIQPSIGRRVFRPA